jgi:hypothetical protein
VPVIEKLRRRDEKLKQHQVRMGHFCMLPQLSVLVNHDLHSSDAAETHTAQPAHSSRQHEASTHKVCACLIVCSCWV